MRWLCPAAPSATRATTATSTWLRRADWAAPRNRSGGAKSAWASAAPQVSRCCKVSRKVKRSLFQVTSTFPMASKSERSARRSLRLHNSSGSVLSPMNDCNHGIRSFSLRPLRLAALLAALALAAAALASVPLLAGAIAAMNGDDLRKMFEAGQYRQVQTASQAALAAAPKDPSLL